ncbi:hypothetical protein AAV99_10130 [Aurantiacibacter marinus]|uniref:Lipoprotein n=2 Tax=Aurantiacibacter marinus TaxID=874156 RepID=A0A0H0XL42_9SPHN|nr:hypothetical protein AAV99_10130 [Aurantiacibacter marinus]
MRQIMLLPLIAIAACSAGNGNKPGSDIRQYPTQAEAPSPDYAALLSNRPQSVQAESLREPTAPQPADAKELGDLWVARLEERGALMGSGLAGKDEDSPIQSIDTLLTAEEFDTWLADNVWTAPPHIRWYFQQPLIAPSVSEAALAGVRVWPATETRTGWQMEAAFSGRIFLRDGCVFMQGFRDGDPEKLAWFHAETGLDVDAEGYFVLINRVSGEIAARLGETMTWAGPNPLDQDNPQIIAYREACGEFEVEGVGNPEANERLYVIYPHLREAPDRAPPPGIE